MWVVVQKDCYDDGEDNSLYGSMGYSIENVFGPFDTEEKAKTFADKSNEDKMYSFDVMKLKEI